MFLSLRMHARHWSNPLGRCFFHCGCMPGTGAVRWGDISFRTSPRRPIEPPILTRRTRDQQTGGTGVMGTEGHGRGAGGRQHGQNKHTRPKPHPIGGHRVACGARPRCRRAAAGPGQTTGQRTEQHQRPGSTGVEGAGGTGGHGRASRSTTPSLQARVWRSRGRPGPPAPGTSAGPQATTRGNKRRVGGQAGRRPEIRRRPEHQQCHTATTCSTNGERAGRRPPAHTAARPFKAGHTAPGNQVAPGTPAALNELRHRKRKAYSPRNALIAGISRTACTRPAR